MVLIVAGWIFFCVIVGLVFFENIALEVMFILSLIGVLVIRELNDRLTSVDLKQRFDIFIYLGTAVFIFIVVAKVLRILGVLG